MDGVRVTGFDSEHLSGVLRLCEREGWSMLPSDPERARLALAAPGVTTVVALGDGELVGFAQMLSDGQVQAYLANLVVASRLRGHGIARTLVQEAYARSGARRVDLLALEGSELFYRSFEHRTLPGYRIYPVGRDG